MLTFKHLLLTLSPVGYHRHRNMKKLLLTFYLLQVMQFTIAQDVTVDKSIWGVQTGVLGIWVHNESRLSRNIALRTELGLYGGLFKGGYYGTGIILSPGLTLEPRWYYNLNKRATKTKDINNNSANFVTLSTSFIPDLFVVSNYDNNSVRNQISLIPTWGVRRNIGKRWNFELVLC